MSIRSLEAAILAELKEVSGNTKVKQQHIMEWSTSTVNVREDEGERRFYLPQLQIHVAVKMPEVTHE